MTTIPRKTAIPRLAIDKPSLGRLVISLLETDEKTESGLYLPHGKETLANVGRVRFVCDEYFAGPDDKDASPQGPQFSVDQVVIIGKYNGTEVEINREKFVIINESDVMCTLKEIEE